jgi:hypothetical protein
MSPSLAAALLDSLFAHPAGDPDTDTAHELIVTYCATIEVFRSLIDPSGCGYVIIPKKHEGVCDAVRTRL